MTRRFKFFEGEFYHIYNRGTEKRNIFINKHDYNRFILLLHHANQIKPVVVKKLNTFEQKETILVDIVSYCLMPNHFHIIIHERSDGGISRFIQKLSTAYTMYFNKKYDRSGALFQGKFKATHVDSDRYLKYLISYIHLNPIALIDSKWKENRITNKTVALEYLNSYESSSYLDYIGVIRQENCILSFNILPEYFKHGRDFESFVTEWLNYDV